MTGPLTICFIGTGAHAARIQNVLSDLDLSYRPVVFDRTTSLDSQVALLSSDAVFITSPNDTHAFYLRALCEFYDGYIYCEKPPINTHKDLDVFDIVDSSRCFFGFNFRYSPLLKEVRALRSEFGLGRLVNLDIHYSYPFAIRPEYLVSWKSDRTSSPLGVLENLGIHFIDMSVTLSGEIETISFDTTNTIDDERSVDTANILLKHASGATSTIFVSYATSYFTNMYFTFSCGDIHYDGARICVYTPRETFGSQGLSIRPPQVISKPLDSNSVYNESLRECVADFMTIVSARGAFQPELVKRSKEVVSAMFLAPKI